LQLPLFFPILGLMSENQKESATFPGFSSEEVHLPAVIARNEKKVRRSFWKKMLKVAGRIPFAEDAASAFYCATDAQTPWRVRATLLAALAYFITPIDLIPDLIATLGFTDDAAVLMMAISMVSGHIKPKHSDKARKMLGKPPQKPNSSENA